MRTTCLPGKPSRDRVGSPAFAAACAVAFAFAFTITITIAIVAASAPFVIAGGGPQKPRGKSALADEKGRRENEAPDEHANVGERGEPVQLADCPAAVRKAFEAEARGAKARSIIKEKDEHGPSSIYWIDAAVGNRTYVLGVLDDGTLLEMNLAVDGHELPMAQCPEAVRKTFERESFEARIDNVGQDRKFGAPIYVALVEHAGKSYQVIVAHDGTLVEKALVIHDEEVALKDCPQAVRAALHEHAQGGSIGEITRSSGIIRPTYETELKMKRRVYLVEIAEDGALISKSLEAGEE